MSDTWRENAIV